MPYKIWSVNEILTAADMNTYVGNQTILSFAGTAARSSAIGTPVEGMLSYVGGGTVQVYAGTAGWTSISGGGGGGVTVGTSAPSTPAQGDLWWDSDTGLLYVYYDDGTSQQWVDAASPKVFVSDTAPTGYEGQLWLDSTDGSMYTYYTDPGGSASSWIGAVSRSGGILQVVQTAKTDTSVITSTSFTNVTGLSATITPRSTSSKILILVQFSWAHSTVSAHRYVRLSGGNAGTYVGDAAGSRVRATYNTYGQSNLNAGMELVSINDLDSPNTTSSVTYNVQVASNTGNLYINRTLDDTDNTSFARNASSITLIEVAG